MNDFIVNRLRAWAARRDRELHKAVGFKSCCSILAESQGSIPDYTPDIDLDYHEMNQCVNALKFSGRSELYQAIYFCYCRTELKIDAKLALMGCSKQTYYNRLEACYPLLLGWLNDLAAGLMIPCEKEFKKTA